MPDSSKNALEQLIRDQADASMERCSAARRAIESSTTLIEASRELIIVGRNSIERIRHQIAEAHILLIIHSSIMDRAARDTATPEQHIAAPSDEQPADCPS